MTPEQRASKLLFGWPDYVPVYPNVRYCLSGDVNGPRVSYSELVEQYRAEQSPGPTPEMQQEAQLAQGRAWARAGEPPL